MIGRKEVRARETERGEEAENTSATVDFFAGRQKKFWILALILSFLIAAAGIVLAILIPPRGQEAEDIMLNIVFAVAGLLGLVIFAVCILTAKTRTSRWVADLFGVHYFCLGRETLRMAWDDVKETGYLKVVDPRTDAAAFYLYWATDERMSVCRGLVSGGVTQCKPARLGRCNCRRGNLIAYPIDPYDPLHDPLVRFMQAHFPRRMKHPRLLGLAETESGKA